MRKIIFQGGEPVQIVEIFDPDRYVMMFCRRPWYQGRSKKSGRYTKKFANCKQRRDRGKNIPAALKRKLYGY